MYMSHAAIGAARARYRNVDVSSRVESADPHRLVAIVFEELLKTLDAMAIACRRKDWSQRGTRQARALKLVHGLESTLDFETGGELALSLLAIYREARRLVLKGGADNDEAAIGKAREMLGEIAGAWDQIG